MTCIMPIGGNKGGTGKSFICGNLGIALAKRGKRTLIIDLDLGASNLHTMMGMSLPSRSLSDFINRRVEKLEETVIPTPVPELFLISGARNDLDVSNILYQQKRKIVRAISRLSYDYIILDLGAGTSFNTVDFFMISNTGVFVAIPEPTSIENIYRMVRSLFFRMVKQCAGVSDFRTTVSAARERNPEGHTDYLDNLLLVFGDLFPEKAAFFENLLKGVSFKLVMNQMRDSDNPGLGDMMCRVIEKHLGVSVVFLGNIAYNSYVHDSVCNRILFMDKYPYTQTTTDIRKLSETVIAINRENNEDITGGDSTDKIQES